jgi:hypothetical protein
VVIGEMAVPDLVYLDEELHLLTPIKNAVTPKKIGNIIAEPGRRSKGFK